jgi:hypothetical protein
LGVFWRLGLGWMSEYFERWALIQTDGIWQERNFYRDGSGNIEYICRNKRFDALTSDEDWYVWRFYYTGSNLDKIRGPLRGAADDRATLDW